jgi:hypothetical protein
MANLQDITVAVVIHQLRHNGVWNVPDMAKDIYTGLQRVFTFRPFPEFFIDAVHLQIPAF